MTNGNASSRKQVALLTLHFALAQTMTVKKWVASPVCLPFLLLFGFRP